MRANQIVRITIDFKMDAIKNLTSTDFTPVTILRAFKLLLNAFLNVWWMVWMSLILIKYLLSYHNVLACSERSFAVSSQKVTSMPVLQQRISLSQCCRIFLVKYNSSCDCVIAVLSAIGVLMAKNKAYKSGRTQRNFRVFNLYITRRGLFVFQLLCFCFLNLFLLKETRIKMTDILDSTKWLLRSHLSSMTV